ncbi:Uncharacterized protein HZ326_29666 [Fusarium oxysporum f. sp. albedinis]|nr:Uncharacterized protein HZ326_29666 [Fusarium oxysporum f. sp. albedinis]
MVGTATIMGTLDLAHLASTPGIDGGRTQFRQRVVKGLELGLCVSQRENQASRRGKGEAGTFGGNGQYQLKPGWGLTPLVTCGAVRFLKGRVLSGNGQVRCATKPQVPQVPYSTTSNDFQRDPQEALDNPSTDNLPLQYSQVPKPTTAP